MAKARFAIDIQRTPQTVFQLLSDLPGYRSWLPPSQLYSETTAVSDLPVKVGTTYVDRGPSSEMQGEVTGLEPFTHIAFRQSSQFKRSLLRGTLEIRIRYTLQPIEQGTHVIRELSLHAGGMLQVLQPVLLRAIRKEDDRILQRMKWFLEAR